MAFKKAENHKKIRRARFERRLKNVQSVHARYSQNRSQAQKTADAVTDFSGTISFLLINAVFFALWISWNVGIIPAVEPFDPFPFTLLTTIVSLEAIFLAIFVLITQKRESTIADLRQEVDLQINLISEEEITKLIQLVSGLYPALHVKVEKDSELEHMLKPTDSEEIEKRLEEQLRVEK